MESLNVGDVCMVADHEDEFHGLESLPDAFGFQMKDGRSFIIIPEIASQTVSLLPV